MNISDKITKFSHSTVNNYSPTFRAVKVPYAMTKPISPETLKTLSLASVAALGTAFVAKTNLSEKKIPDDIREERELILEELKLYGLKDGTFAKLKQKNLDQAFLALLNIMKKDCRNEYYEIIGEIESIILETDCVKNLSDFSDYFINNMENIYDKTMKILDRQTSNNYSIDSFLDLYGKADKAETEKIYQIISKNKSNYKGNLEDFIIMIKCLVDNNVDEISEKQLALYDLAKQYIDKLYGSTLKTIFNATNEDIDIKERYLLTLGEQSFNYEYFDLINSVNYEIYELIRNKKETFQIRSNEYILGAVKPFNKEFAKRVILDDYYLAKDIIVKTNEENIALAEEIYDNPNIPRENFADILNIINLSKNINSLSTRQIFEINNNLNQVPNSIIEELSKYNIDIIKIQADINDKIKKGVKNISTTKEARMKFAELFLSNKNLRAQEILKTFNFDDFASTGLPLKYSREDFNNRMESLLSELTEKEQKILLKHFGITRGVDGFDGLINDSDFSSDNATLKMIEIAKQMQQEIKRFTLENEFLIDDIEAKALLDAILKGIPEFAFYVGKKQHGTHKYTVDIHTLKVLQSAMNNPKYDKLKDNEKTILKISAILHDIGKQGGIVDTGHEEYSASYAKDILKRFSFKPRFSDSIIRTIGNHHWFAAYCKNEIPEEAIKIVASMCVEPGTFNIYSILAKADFENVNETFHLVNTETNSQEEFNQFIEQKMQPVKKYLEEFIYTNSNLIYDTKFLDNGEHFSKEKVNIDGEETILKVLNLNEIPTGSDMEKWGFVRGTTKEKLRFFVHMLRNFDINGNITKYVTEYAYLQSCWSTSLISASNNNAYGEFGFILDVDQSNISEALYKNLGSGNEKDFNVFIDILCNSPRPEARTFIKKALLEELSQKGYNLSEQNYALLVKQIISKQYLSQINKDIKIDNIIIKSQDLVECLERSRDRLFEGEGHSEIVVLNPRIRGIIALKDNLSKCPNELLKFAAENDLPIILMNET